MLNLNRKPLPTGLVRRFVSPRTATAFLHPKQSVDSKKWQGRKRPIPARVLSRRSAFCLHFVPALIQINLSPFSSACDYKPVQYYATGGALQTETFRQQLFTDEQPA